MCVMFVVSNKVFWTKRVCHRSLYFFFFFSFAELTENISLKPRIQISVEARGHSVSLVVHCS